MCLKLDFYKNWYIIYLNNYCIGTRLLSPLSQLDGGVSPLMMVPPPPVSGAQADPVAVVQPDAGAGTAAQLPDPPLFVIGRGDPPESDESDDPRVQFGPLHVAVTQELSPKLGAKKKGASRGRGRSKDPSYNRASGSRLRPRPRPARKADM